MQIDNEPLPLSIPSPQIPYKFHEEFEIMRMELSLIKSVIGLNEASSMNLCEQAMKLLP